jgi:fumarate hydratase subunit beta
MPQRPPQGGSAINITSPIKTEVLEKLTAGTKVLISGVVYTARDAAHQRLTQALEKGERLPFDLKGQTLYYMGPSPAPPGRLIGAAGPTTSSRIDKYTPRLLAAGIRAMMGKGNRSPEVREAIKKYKAVYFVTIGGAGALLSKAIKKAEVIAYDDLGAEAIRRLKVKDFPAIVANDIHGGDLFAQERAKYQRGKAPLT